MSTATTSLTRLQGVHQWRYCKFVAFENYAHSFHSTTPQHLLEHVLRMILERHDTWMMHLWHMNLVGCNFNQRQFIKKDGKFNAFRNIVHFGLRFTNCFAAITQFAEVVGPDLFGTLVMATLPTHELLGLQVQPSSGTSRRPVNFPLFRSYIPLFHTTVVAAGTAGQQRLHIRPLVHSIRS